jgi:NADPH-dependent curcumin reductase
VSSPQNYDEAFKRQAVDMILRGGKTVKQAAEEPDRLAATMREVLTKSLTLRGFINYEFAKEHYPQFLQTVSKAIADGRVRYLEYITDGLENASGAFIGMLEGRNFGKALVRVAL